MKSYQTAARQGLYRDQEAILMAFSDMQISKTRELKIACMHNRRKIYSVYSRKPYLLHKHELNLMNRPNRQWTVARYPVAERSRISNF